MSEGITAEKLKYLYDELSKQANKQKDEPQIILNGHTWLALGQQCQIIINENENLKAENAELNHKLMTLISENIEKIEMYSSSEMITKLTRKLEIYKAAIEFYSPEIVYRYDDVKGVNYIWNDQGKRARQAIQEAEGVG